MKRLIAMYVEVSGKLSLSPIAVSSGGPAVLGLAICPDGLGQDA